MLRLPTAPAPTVGFFDLGMDSLMAVELRNRLNRAFGGAYTASNTVVFDYPDIASLAGHLVDELAAVVGADAAPAPQPDPATQPTTQRADEDGADAIAIVGMACRFPGAPDLPAFWQQLDAGANAVTDERRETGPWSDFIENLPTQYAAFGRAGFVDGIDQFDARFFGISPIEARLMDPQQRMLLETTWQALEDAGIDPDGLKGSRTGVYAGIATSEYRELMRNGDYGIGYLSTAASMAVGRLAFRFGLAGPTLPVELNCASSLVAVHQAVTGLRLGEADLALVGGVSAVLSAPITREMADLGLLSRDGACKTFDAGADGFVRGEGCGMVVLKRLAEAEADGDRIWAVIRGSAVNQNGASAGATVPNGPAQERVIEQALSQAGVAPSEVDYLEAHGAGSAFGDPIEVQAAAAVYGRGRDADRPLLIGSVKTNIGHLESAAGIAGLIKAVLAMTQGVIPRHLNVQTPSPLIEWDRLPVRVATEAVDWPLDPDRPPRAGVSAFGISGVNSHVVLEGRSAPDGAAAEGVNGPSPAGVAQRVAACLPQSDTELSPALEDGLAPRGARLLPLSAKSEDALRALAGRYLAWLHERADLIALEAAATNPLLSDMAWTAGVGRSHLACRAGVVFPDAASLRDRLTALADGGGTLGSTTAARVAFVYPGEDSHWAGVGRALYEGEPVARAVLDRCEAVPRDERGESLLDAMFGRAGPGEPLDGPTWARPASYALACALTALWTSVGIRPSVVAGHGAGEIAAAQSAGVFSLEDGLRLAAAAGGTEAWPDGIATTAPSIGLVSGATGRLVEPSETADGMSRYGQAGEPAPLEQCATTLAESGVEAVIEIGPDAVLGPALARSWAASASEASVPATIASLRRPSADETGQIAPSGAGFVDAVAAAYEAGLPIDFAGLFAGEMRRRISLPGYPFQRHRHWLQRAEEQAPAVVTRPG